MIKFWYDVITAQLHVSYGTFGRLFNFIFPHIPHSFGIFALIKWTTIYPSNCEMSGKFIILKIKKQCSA